jgi:5-methyltetrahydropteroyltriglutamate--homocysteine methyltransferase
MRVLVANHGSMPAPDGAAPGGSRPRAGTHDPREDVRALTRRVIREQAAAGIDLVTDGQLEWTQGAAHVLTGVDGVRFDAPAQRAPAQPSGHLQPVVESKLRHRAPLLAEAYRRAREAAAPLDVKAVVPGPYSLGHLCRVSTTAYEQPADLAVDLSVILAEEVRELVREGAALVQVDEPRILEFPGDIRLLRELLEPLEIACGDADLAVATYFGDATPLYAQLNSLPSDLLALDCAGRIGLMDLIADTGSGKVLALGLVDGRRAELEDCDELLRALERLLHRYVHDRVILQPSCGLAGLPWDVARRKLDRLVEVRERFAAR